MVGDYNYPVFKDNLAEKVRDFGYELTLSDARTYTRYKFFRGHFDLATSVGFAIDRVETLPRGSSDHLPILVDARYAGRPGGAGRRRHLSPAGRPMAPARGDARDPIRGQGTR